MSLTGRIIRQAATLRQRNWPLLAQAIERGINAPRASSCGRLFDAVACALDCAPESLSYEGEAACRLEALAASCPGVSHPVTLPWRDDALDLATFWRQWLSWQATPAQKAWAFHDALACGLAAMAPRLRHRPRHRHDGLQRRGAA